MSLRSGCIQLLGFAIQRYVSRQQTQESDEFDERRSREKDIQGWTGRYAALNQGL